MPISVGQPAPLNHDEQFWYAEITQEFKFQHHHLHKPSKGRHENASITKEKQAPPCQLSATVTGLPGYPPSCKLGR